MVGPDSDRPRVETEEVHNANASDRFQFENRVTDFLEILGFVRSKEKYWRGRSVNEILRKLRGNGVIHYQKGSQSTIHLSENNARLLILPPTPHGPSVCLYGPRGSSAKAATTLTYKQPQSEIDMGIEVARVSYICLFSSGQFYNGGIEAIRYRKGFLGFNERSDTSPRILQTIKNPNREEQIVKWMQAEKGQYFNA